MKSVHLASEEDADRVLPLVAAFHAERGLDSDEDRRLEAVGPLLAGSQLGAIWLIGPRRAPVGYIAVTFGWSISRGGLTGTIDELYVRPAVRRRGMGSEALDAICRAMREAGLVSLAFDSGADEERLHSFARRARFEPGTDRLTMRRAF